MLLANISTAERTYEEFKESALLRRHPAPLQPSFEELKRSLKCLVRRGGQLVFAT